MLGRDQDWGVQAVGAKGLEDRGHLDDLGTGSHDGKNLGGQGASFLAWGSAMRCTAHRPLLTLAEPRPGAKIRPGVRGLALSWKSLDQPPMNTDEGNPGPVPGHLGGVGGMSLETSVFIGG